MIQIWIYGFRSKAGYKGTRRVTNLPHCCQNFITELTLLSRTLNLTPSTVRMDLMPTIEDVSPDTSSKADYSNSISAALQPPPSVVLDYVDDYEVSQN